MRTHRILIVLACFLFVAGAGQSFAQTPTVAATGYAIVTPATSPSKPLGGQVTIEQDRGTTAFDEGIVFASLSDSFMIPLSWNSATSEDLGLAFVNPQLSSATMSVALNGVDGIQASAPVSLTIPAGSHIAKLTRQQLFQDAFGLSDPFVGSVQVTSSVLIAVTALQFQGADYRPVSPVVTGSTGNLPAKGNIGGAGALIFPQIVFGGNWFSEIAVINPNSAAVGVRVDLFDNNGNPWLINLNGTSASTFSTQVAGNGVAIFTTPAQADLRSLRTLLARSNQVSDLEANILTGITQANAEVNAAPAGAKTTILVQLQTALAQVSASINALNGQTASQVSQILLLMNQVRSTAGAASLSSIESAIASLGVLVNANMGQGNTLANVALNLIVQINVLLGPNACPLCIPPIPIPVPGGG